MNPIKGKKADIDLSLQTIIGIVLAMMALIAIFSLIASLYNIFTDTEKEQGAEKGFFQLSGFVESLKTGAQAIPVPVMLTENYAIIGFNPNQNQAIGKCGEPSINHKALAASVLDFAITRDPVKCPLDSVCLCLCKAQKINSMFRGVFDNKFDYVDCFTGAICQVYPPKKGTVLPNFQNTDNCKFAMIFDTKVTTVELSKDSSNNIIMKKKQ
jgi:hypothetical protein